MKATHCHKQYCNDLRPDFCTLSSPVFVPPQEEWWGWVGGGGGGRGRGGGEHELISREQQLEIKPSSIPSCGTV